MIAEHVPMSVECTVQCYLSKPNTLGIKEKARFREVYGLERFYMYSKYREQDLIINTSILYIGFQITDDFSFYGFRELVFSLYMWESIFNYGRLCTMKTALECRCSACALPYTLVYSEFSLIHHVQFI